MIDLYGRATSGNSYKARLLLALLGVPYRGIDIRLGVAGRNDVDHAYLALNPRGPGAPSLKRKRADV